MNVLQRFAEALYVFAYPEQRTRQATSDAPAVAPEIVTVFGGTPNSSALTSSQQKNAWRGLVYRCLDIRASAIAGAMLDFTVERKIGQLEYEAVELTHPWVMLLDRPNPHLSPYDFYKTVALLRDIVGSADLVIRRDGRGVPFEFYPVYPAFGELVPNPDSSGGVASYTFYRADGKKFTYPAEDVIRIKHVNPISPYENASLIQAAGFQIDTDLYMRIYRRDTMRHGSPLQFVLSSDQELTETQAKLYGEQFKKNFMGLEVIGEMKGVPVMGKGLKPVPMTLSAKDAEFINGAKLNNTEIMQIFGVPEGMVSDDANRANAEASRAIFYQNTVEPEAKQISSSLTLSLENAFDAKTGVLYVLPPDLAPRNQEFELKQDTELVKTAAMTINDVRRKRGLEEIEGGDTPLIATGLQRLEDVLSGKAIQPPVNTDDDGDPSDPQKPKKKLKPPADDNADDDNQDQGE